MMNRYLVVALLVVFSVLTIKVDYQSSNSLSRSLRSEHPNFHEELGPMPRVIQSRQSTGFCKSNAIVYLAQKKHSSYANRDSYGMLKKSIDLLYRNYLNVHHEGTNLFIFHTNDFFEEDLTELEAGVARKGVMNLVDLDNTTYWHIPPWIADDNPSRDWSQPNVYSVGYRHMIRWYAVRIWDYFNRINRERGCNYKFIMRMDEESYLHSPIDYNLFGKMVANNYVYGFRSCSYEMKHVDRLWKQYHRTHPHVVPKRDFFQKGLCGFYNNFFIASLDFFSSQPVQSFLQFADHTGSMYRQRRNDLILQTAAVYAFADSDSQIHRFLDFTYEHFTSYKSGCPMWGSLATGYADPNGNMAAENLYEKLTQNGCPRDYEDFKVKMMDIPVGDLSPTYAHLPSEYQGVQTLRYVKAGFVDVPNKGITSG